MWKYILILFGLAGVCTADDLQGYSRIDHKEGTSSKVMLTDPGFEKSGSGWELKPGFAVEKGSGRSATHALKYVRNNRSDYAIASTRIDVKPGAFYRFGSWIKTSGVTTSPQGGGATIAMEFSKKGKDGRNIFLTGRYLRGITGTKDWTFVSDVVRIPKNASAVSLSLYIWKGASGTAWFDDITVQEQGANLWSLYTLNPYQTVADGKCTVAVSYDGKSVAGRDLEVRMQIKENGMVRRAKVREDRAEIELGKLAPGRYDAEFMILDSAKKTVCCSTRIPLLVNPSAHPAVAIDRFGRTVVNGRPFLPLGIFTAGLDSRTMDTLREAGLNCVLPYSSMNLKLDNNAPASPEQIIKVMDLAESKGLKVIFSCKDVGSSARYGVQEWHGTKGQDAIIRRITGLLKKHPALLAWYINDEQPSSQIERLTAMRRLFNQMDANHPTYGVLYQYEDLPMYGSTSDIIGVDPYPLNGDNLKKAVYAMTQSRLAGLPAWVVPQAANISIYSSEKKLENPQNPSEEKMRSLALLEAAYGARGFIFYKYEDLKSWKLPKDNFAKEWAKVKRVVAALKSLEPYIMSEYPVELLSEGEVVAARLRNPDGKTVIVICAVGPGTASVKLKLGDRRYRSKYGYTSKQNGEWTFRGSGICSDLLFEE